MAVKNQKKVAELTELSSRVEGLKTQLSIVDEKFSGSGVFEESEREEILNAWGSLVRLQSLIDKRKDEIGGKQ